MSSQVFLRAERDELFRRHVVAHIPALLVAARGRTGQLADTEDLVQDSWRVPIGRFSPSPNAPSAWLMTMLRKRNAEASRRR
jgi:DNA-directed RNA polymerase specialized sigma24 family protein